MRYKSIYSHGFFTIRHIVMQMALPPESIFHYGKHLSRQYPALTDTITLLKMPEITDEV